MQASFSISLDDLNNMYQLFVRSEMVAMPTDTLFARPFVVSLSVDTQHSIHGANLWLCIISGCVPTGSIVPCFGERASPVHMHMSFPCASTVNECVPSWAH